MDPVVVVGCPREFLTRASRSNLVTTDLLFGFRDRVIGEFEYLRKGGEFVRLLQEYEPGPDVLKGADLYSQATDVETLIEDDSRELEITELELRKMPVVISDQDLIGAAGEARERLPEETIAQIVRATRARLEPGAAETEADGVLDMRWYQTGASHYGECVGCRTFVREDPEGLRVVQDRLIGVVQIPDSLSEVFVGLRWERRTAVG
jgi:hypothetical protein